MLHFESDYIKGAHPQVLQALVDSNLETLSGYTTDYYCKRAAEHIVRLCGTEHASVHFLVGGTQTNAIVIDSMISRHQGVIAVETGHIATHEAGAIERTGHKVLTLPHHQGKMDATELSEYLQLFYADANHSHMVFPGMVYLSHPTEYGTLYTADELRMISDICQMYKIPLFVDGARLLYGLAAETDVDLPLLAELCDVFYIGGTKAGTLCGEAVVFCKDNEPVAFTTIVKQHGALLAKGRLLGVQFDALFRSNLWKEIGAHAIKQSKQLQQLLTTYGFSFYLTSPTNQQFVILENHLMKQLAQQVGFSYWEAYDEHHTVVRFATSWSTTDEELVDLAKVLEVIESY